MKNQWRHCPSCGRRHKNRRRDAYCRVACRRKSDPLLWLIERVKSTRPIIEPQKIATFVKHYRESTRELVAGARMFAAEKRAAGMTRMEAVAKLKSMLESDQGVENGQT